jgi:hypothetical protein
MSKVGAAPRAAVPMSNARAEASRRNGAKSRGPKTLEGKARSAQNALKHGLRALNDVVLPDEDAPEFAEREAMMIEELTPLGRWRPCSPGASRSPPGGSPAPIASRPSALLSAGEPARRRRRHRPDPVLGVQPEVLARAASRRSCATARRPGRTVTRAARPEGARGRASRGRRSSASDQHRVPCAERTRAPAGDVLREPAIVERALHETAAPAPRPEPNEPEPWGDPGPWVCPQTRVGAPSMDG